MPRESVSNAWVGVLDAAYAAEPDERAWLTGVVEAARPLLPDGPMSYGFVYDARDAAKMEIGSLVTSRRPPGVEPEIAEAGIRMSQGGLSAGEVRRSFWTTQAATASELLGVKYDDTLRITELAGPFGIRDTLGISAPDPTRRGVALVAAVERPQRVSAARRRLFLRMAAHLSAALRLRIARGRPASIEDGEAVVDEGGHVVHATGPARESTQREAIVATARAIVRARSLAPPSPEDATEAWRALTEARWSIVERLDVDGRRFFVAVENEVQAPASESLSPRERAVLAFAAMGHANKAIAYDLGLPPAAVARALSEAQRKLGLRSRSELVSLFAGLLGAGAAR